MNCESRGLWGIKDVVQSVVKNNFKKLTGECKDPSQFPGLIRDKGMSAGK